MNLCKRILMNKSPTAGVVGLILFFAISLSIVSADAAIDDVKDSDISVAVYDELAVDGAVPALNRIDSGAVSYSF